MEEIICPYCGSLNSSHEIEDEMECLECGSAWPIEEYKGPCKDGKCTL